MQTRTIPLVDILEVIETFLTSVDWHDLADAYLALRELGMYSDDEIVDAIAADLDDAFDFDEIVGGPLGIFLEGIDEKVWRTLVSWKIKAKIARAARKAKRGRNMSEIAETLRAKALAAKER